MLRFENLKRDEGAARRKMCIGVVVVALMGSSAGTGCSSNSGTGNDDGNDDGNDPTTTGTSFIPVGSTSNCPEEEPSIGIQQQCSEPALCAYERQCPSGGCVTNIITCEESGSDWKVYYPLCSSGTSSCGEAVSCDQVTFAGAYDVQLVKLSGTCDSAISLSNWDSDLATLGGMNCVETNRSGPTACQLTTVLQCSDYFFYPGPDATLVVEALLSHAPAHRDTWGGEFRVTISGPTDSCQGTYAARLTR